MNVLCPSCNEILFGIRLDEHGKPDVVQFPDADSTPNGYEVTCAYCEKVHVYKPIPTSAGHPSLLRFDHTKDGGQ